MSNILYTSGGSFFVKTDACLDEYASEKIANYHKTLKSINRKNE